MRSVAMGLGIALGLLAASCGCGVQAVKVGVYPGLKFTGESRFVVRPISQAVPLERVLVGQGYRVISVSETPVPGEDLRALHEMGATYLVRVEGKRMRKKTVRILDLETGDPVAMGEGYSPESVLSALLEKVRDARRREKR